MKRMRLIHLPQNFPRSMRFTFWPGKNPMFTTSGVSSGHPLVVRVPPYQKFSLTSSA
jgi:hypothetical protein